MTNIRWIAARRDHDGNYDVLRMPNGKDFAWELTEAEAESVIEFVQRDQLKIHGQSYWKLCYECGKLKELLSSHNIRI